MSSCAVSLPEHGLLVTGSSDYHGTGKPNLLGENLTTPEVLARIEELGNRDRRRPPLTLPLTQLSSSNVLKAANDDS